MGLIQQSMFCFPCNGEKLRRHIFHNTTMQLFLSGLQTVQLAERNFRLIVISEKTVFFSPFFQRLKRKVFLYLMMFPNSLKMLQRNNYKNCIFKQYNTMNIFNVFSRTFSAFSNSVNCRVKEDLWAIWKLTRKTHAVLQLRNAPN